MRNGRQERLPAHNPSHGAPSSWSNPMIGFGDHYEVKQSLSAFLSTIYRGRRKKGGGGIITASLVWLLLAFCQSDGSCLSVSSLAGGFLVERDIYHTVEETRPHFHQWVRTQHTDSCSARPLSYIWPSLSVFKCLSQQKCRIITLSFSCQPQGQASVMVNMRL